MVLIINDKENKLEGVNWPNLVIFDDPCKVKTYKRGSYVVVMLGASVEDDGKLSGYDYMFEELLITLDVIAIITTADSEKLAELCEHYHIPLISVR